MRRSTAPGWIPLLVLAGCLGSVSDPGGGEEPVCRPGTARSCDCPSGVEGEQTCRADGGGYGDCDCEIGPHDLLCGGGICEDEQSGLLWQQSPSGQVFTWMEARHYCDELVLGGEEDWRLPDLDDLRTLVRGCPASEPSGSCAVDDRCLDPWCGDDCVGCDWNGGPGADGCYWPPELSGNCWGYWSIARVSNLTEAWYLVFDSAQVAFKATDDLNQARCLRTP